MSSSRRTHASRLACDMVCPTNAFISGSPKLLPQRPAKPPPNPLIPAIPTEVPDISTRVPSPSNTVMPWFRKISRSSGTWSVW
ncbi:Uncharacterised protein [Mycobacteroides abscessus subsp. abscessus]|nr:Uncharacterised protein [Mycobacteroides abscessus subsp. abscessus]